MPEWGGSAPNPDQLFFAGLGKTGIMLALVGLKPFHLRPWQHLLYVNIKMTFLLQASIRFISL
jgi:hypothetical protein